MDIGTGRIFIQRVWYGGATTCIILAPLTSLGIDEDEFYYLILIFKEKIILSLYPNSMVINFLSHSHLNQIKGIDVPVYVLTFLLFQNY